MVKFTANNKNFVFTQLFQFFVLKSLYLRIKFDIIYLFDIITFKQINKKKTINISKAI